MIREILVTLNYSHSMNIAHRDLKPENILVKNLADKSKCRIKIIDWGFGKLLKDSQFFNRICGTN